VSLFDIVPLIIIVGGVLSVLYLFRLGKRIASRIRGLLATAARARKLQIVDSSRGLEARGNDGERSIRVSAAFNIDCEGNVLINHHGADVCVLVCVSGASKDVTLQFLSGSTSRFEPDRVLLGDESVDALLHISCFSDSARQRVVTNRDELSKAFRAFMELPHSEGRLDCRLGTIELRRRQNVMDWNLHQLLALIDTAVAIAKLA